jgi:hypothetical protein
VHAELQQIPSAQKPLVHSFPSVHGVGVHVAPAYDAHAPAPSHRPFFAQEGVPSSVQSFRGSWAASTGAHVPLAIPVMATAQATQVASQAVLQQMLSAQNPEAHVATEVHAVPSGSSVRISAVSEAAGRLPPPVMRTRPSSRSVAVWNARASVMSVVAVQVFESGSNSSALFK